MRRLRFGALRIEWMALALLTGTCAAEPALAHKMVVFATGADHAIEGEAYFHGGDPARDVEVTLLGPNDQVLGQTTTDREGKFRIPIQFRCDYRVIADAGAGHGAEYTVPADELPDDLPQPDGAIRPGGESTKPAVRDEHAAQLPPRDRENAAPLGGTGVSRLGGTGVSPVHGQDARGTLREGAPAIAPDERAARAASHDAPLPVGDADRGHADVEAIGRQVAALRRDFDRYRNELRLRDVLGGLGYILGIMGTAFYFLGVRRREKHFPTEDTR